MSEESPTPAFKSNVPELTVSELAFSLKRTLEETYGRVRVRGELSRVKIHSSGHMYSDLKDADFVLNVVCWRGTLQKLPVKPEEGLDVICTGKITSYPARSNYQMVIEHMELAGEGALLKMLEDRRKKLAAEGLFDENRKKPRPFIPNVIGVITSPTGAVIRDILHRLEDRFPTHVILWPVRVQGDGAAEEIAAAINGMNQLDKTKGFQRPDLIIVARGGGSLEDLMPFNDEAVVRAAAGSQIPLISAVGHETDTTLIDYAADLRAPTPTAAAELAVPERRALWLTVKEDERRLLASLSREIKSAHTDLNHLTAKFGDPNRILEPKIQKLDMITDRLSHRIEKLVSVAKDHLLRSGARLPNPSHLLQLASKNLTNRTDNLERLGKNIIPERINRLDHTSKMLEILSFKSVLNRGFAVIRDNENTPVTSANDARNKESMSIEFADGKIAVIQKKS